MKLLVFLLFLFSCSNPYIKYNEILVSDVNIKINDSIRYIKIRFKDSRIFTKESYNTLDYAYIEYKNLTTNKIPNNYLKIRKYDILNVNLEMSRHDDGKPIKLIGPSIEKNKASFHLIHLFKCQLIINGYLPDSCFVHRD